MVVRSGGEVGEAHGKVWVETEFERIHINAHMRIEHGSLQVTPDPIIFDDCFPVSETWISDQTLYALWDKQYNSEHLYFKICCIYLK